MPKMLRMKPKGTTKKIKPRKQPSMFEATPKDSIKNKIDPMEDAPHTNTEVTFKIRPRISFVVSCQKHTTTKKGFIGSSHFSGVGEFHNIESARQVADLLMEANKRHKDRKLVLELPDSWFEQQLAALTAMREVLHPTKEAKQKAEPKATDPEKLKKNAKHLRNLLLVKKSKRKKRKRV